ncbi:MAG TPA: hypothetical protein VJ964_04290, partial [Balneolaceae bacterium]|nr:hypothetical protein [Balneolaceae bacterium]
MSTYTRDSLRRALQNQIGRLQTKESKLKQLSNRLSFGRLATFIGGFTFVYLAGEFGPEWLFWTILVAFILGFGKLIRIHKKIDATKQKITIWKSIRSTHLARQSLDWSHIPERSPSGSYADHPFGNDLNIIGQHSLLQLIDTSAYQGSTDRLASYLLETDPQIEKINKRRSIVEELSNKPQFRDRLHLLAEIYKRQELENDWTLEELIQHLQQSEERKYWTPLFILGGLSALNIILGILYLIGLINPYVIFSWLLYLIVYNFNSEKIKGLYDEASQLEKILSRFNAILHYLETNSYQPGSQLKNFCRPFWDHQDSPSKYVKRIIRIASAASSQQSEIIWALLNFLVPWDLYFSQKLSSYKKEVAPRLSEWVTHFYELEAYSSMANFAWLHPDYNFSIPDPEAQLPFKATNLGHPLISQKQKVTNNVTIEHKGDILLITGSNMAGKSTFLRTTGINLALCFAGAPVNASSLITIPFRIFSSINITDSLDNGISHFYAEVKRLRGLLNRLEDNNETPVFFMVDEIYRGTNNRERLQGSKAFLQNVAGRNGVGLVSTHDLELAQLEEKIPALSNWHFAETLEDGKMHFEYKL